MLAFEPKDKAGLAGRLPPLSLSHHFFTQIGQTGAKQLSSPALR